ncbi:hypothetical protein CLOM_g8657 [Closterium sp. NIES-68]|nr:hypothetical protein CLOM_g8657 [Closterium sp. NIES-68]GJP68473.1 hypothetical protein CLOP_g25178 [Closterium sp. NIES-67]
MAGTATSSILQFATWQSSVDVSFWEKLAALKVDSQGLKEEDVAIHGFFTPSSHSQLPSFLSLSSASFPPSPPPPPRFQLIPPGNTTNTTDVTTDADVTTAADVSSTADVTTTPGSSSVSNSSGASSSDITNSSSSSSSSTIAKGSDRRSVVTSSSRNVVSSDGRSVVAGVLRIANTVESFRGFDRRKMMEGVSQQLWRDMLSGEAVRHPSLLNAFFLLVYPDIKHWRFHYAFAFPALALPSPATLASAPLSAGQAFSPQLAEAMERECERWREAAQGKEAREAELGAPRGEHAQRGEENDHREEEAVREGVAELREGEEEGQQAEQKSRSEGDEKGEAGADETAAAAAAADVRLASEDMERGAPFFLVHTDFSNQAHPSVKAHPLSEYQRLASAAASPTASATPTSSSSSSSPPSLIIAFFDPCHLPLSPGWPLRNLLLLASLRWQATSLHVLCLRQRHGRFSLHHSLLLHVQIPLPPAGWLDPLSAPATCPSATGWELNSKGRTGARCADLAPLMDPARLADEAASLNLKLMRWRVLPQLQLERLNAAKCLLLGAGTLGCQVARSLLHTSGHRLAIPMPGHPVSASESPRVQADVAALLALIRQSDAVFLLTDTRESRWLPTLLCAAEGKIAINAALGFDSFLVMRHGAPPVPLDNTLATAAPDSAPAESVSAPAESASESGGLGSSSSANAASHASEAEPAPAAEAVSAVRASAYEPSNAPPSASAPIPASRPASAPASPSPKRLGCYFCNDVVAPLNSTTHRTLDQQCTVTRPGLATIAGALAVELLVGLLHHPLGIAAPAEDTTTDNFHSASSPSSSHVSSPLGPLPHQLRGFLSSFSQLPITGFAFHQCTACSPTVVSAYRERGFAFLMDAFNEPKYLEEITGLDKLHAATVEIEVDWDDSEDDSFKDLESV